MVEIQFESVWETATPQMREVYARLGGVTSISNLEKIVGSTWVEIKQMDNEVTSGNLSYCILRVYILNPPEEWEKATPKERCNILQRGDPMLLDDIRKNSVNLPWNELSDNTKVTFIKGLL